MTVELVIHARRRRIGQALRDHIQEKLEKVERLDPRAVRVDVEITHQEDARKECERVELTLQSSGRTLRAEAQARDAWHATDLAWQRLEARLRKAADRRHDHFR
jgi:ribosomal subunit interface protein